MTLKFLLLSEASTIAIGSAVEGVALPDNCFQASNALGEGADPSSQLSNSVSCLYSSVAGLSARRGKKTTNLEIISLARTIPIKCNQLLNQSFALNKVGYLFPSNSPPGFLTIVQTDTTSSFCKGRV